jgi:hypothetical protein
MHNINRLLEQHADDLRYQVQYTKVKDMGTAFEDLKT